MLGVRGKKIVLGIHILLIAIWVGSLLVTLLLLSTKHTYFQPDTYAPVDRIIFIIFDTVVMNISIAVALSGLVFSMFTTWGFFKFRWILFKWMGVILLAFLLMFLAGPAVNGMAATSDIFEAGATAQPDYISYERQTIFYTLLQLFALSIIVFISVIKPWGTRQPKFRINRKIVLISGIIVAVLLLVSSIMQFVQLNHYRNLRIEGIDLSRIPDGIYTGNADYGFSYSVQVEIVNHHLQRIDIVNNRDSFYARLAEGITQKMLREQRIDINAVTGATTTSKVLMKAVETAVKNREIH